MGKPTFQRVNELLSYNARTGLFTYNVPRPGPGPAPGVPYAGSRGKLGYRQLGVDGAPYYAHRLAWLLYYGSWPTLALDHKDGDRSNNKIANLREATASLNPSNQKRRSDNVSGYKGVCWHSQSGKWRAYITVNGRQKSLGLYDSAKAA